MSIIIWALIGYYLLRACVLNGGDSLPSELTAKIEKRYVTCITFEDTPVWPGNTRQPECGTVDIRVIGEGTVPQKQAAEGVTRAICYQIQVQNPFWSTQGEGTTRHEIKLSPRSGTRERKALDGLRLPQPVESELLFRGEFA
ncbi:MAG: hypothetical protein JW730_01795 [Anaerolineales bacterium]|nr:hypothetical protein [Anaerolineales bacterium]